MLNKSIAKNTDPSYTFFHMEFDKLPPHGETLLNDTRTTILEVSDTDLVRLANAAFSRISFTLTREHLDSIAAIVRNDHASRNDRLVASYMIRNACIAAEGTLPLCQDTGTAQIFAWKDTRVRSSGSDREALTRGVETVWHEKNLRYSTVVPDSFFTEHDAGTNLPPQILIQDAGIPADKPAYRFLFCAKGGGSSNKTAFFQETKALLNPASFSAFLRREIAALGTAACPPYTIAVVAGGLSPEQNILALKLATTGFFNQRVPGFDYQVLGSLPQRDRELESLVMEIAAETGLGAQFGGTALATGAVVLRLPRHGASFPVSIGVSCSAHRNLHAMITADGIFLEKTVTDPASIPEYAEAARWYEKESGQSTSVRLDDGIPAVLASLADHEPGTPLLLNGKLILARDAAHARWKALLDRGEELPGYATRYAIMYAGPAKKPKHACSGSLGPTTAGRMDSYADDLMSRGAALVTIAKGNRSAAWTDACRKYGAVYLGLPGGVAALIADQYITSSEVLDYDDLGMEAVRLVTVKNLPAFLVTTARGEDFYRILGEKHT